MFYGRAWRCGRKGLLQTLDGQVRNGNQGDGLLRTPPNVSSDQGLQGLMVMHSLRYFKRHTLEQVASESSNSEGLPDE